MTPDEKAELMAVAQRLAAEAVRELQDAGVLVAAPTLLEMSYRDCQRHVARAYAVGWLCDQLYHHWAQRPDVPLSTVLKTEPRHRIELFARELQVVGLHDLDDLLLPADPETGE